MIAQIIDLDHGAAETETQDHSPSYLAREYLLGTPRYYVILKLITGIIAVLLTSGLDIGLMYNAQSQSEKFTDAFGNSVGSILALWTASVMSLGIFILIG